MTNKKIMTDINNKIHYKRYINIQDLEIDETLQNELLSCFLHFHNGLFFNNESQEAQLHMWELYKYQNSCMYEHEQLAELIEFLEKNKIDYISIKEIEYYISIC
tara:strand:- start:519 stop:830 length:312 start_codon:yes stop_codon:yes gene_type:complete